jgi:hypothetical protein
LSYSQDKNASTPPVPPKSNSRVRSERNFGEVMIIGILLKELREKAEAKKNKLLKQSRAQQSQRSTTKKS